MPYNRKPMVTIVVIAFLLMYPLTGCDNPNDGDNETTATTTAVISPLSCVPCGDLDLRCPMACEISGCPVCFDMDESGETMIWVFDDGSYYILDNTIIAFYDSDDTLCFKLVIDAAQNKSTYYGSDDQECYTMISDAEEGKITYIVGTGTYVMHEDQTWECPDGSTWVMDPSCEEAEYEEVDSPDISSCPPVTQPCSGEQFPQF